MMTSSAITRANDLAVAAEAAAPEVDCASQQRGVYEWLTRYERLLSVSHYRRMHVIDPRDKVRNLGRVLKCYIQSLRAQWNRKVELVFVIDSSSSIGRENFTNELKFVKKLLSDFTVDTDNTRVSLITFSNKDAVISHVNHLSQAENPAANHKCSLLDQLQRVGRDYKGGGTYTLGGLMEAQVS